MCARAMVLAAALLVSAFQHLRHRRINRLANTKRAEYDVDISA